MKNLFKKIFKDHDFIEIDIFIDNNKIKDMDVNVRDLFDNEKQDIRLMSFKRYDRPEVLSIRIPLKFKKMCLFQFHPWLSDEELLDEFEGMLGKD